jgi:hypothetical protein
VRGLIFASWRWSWVQSSVWTLSSFEFIDAVSCSCSWLNWLTSKTSCWEIVKKILEISVEVGDLVEPKSWAGFFWAIDQRLVQIVLYQLIDWPLDHLSLFYLNKFIFVLSNRKKEECIFDRLGFVLCLQWAARCWLRCFVYTAVSMILAELCKLYPVDLSLLANGSMMLLPTWLKNYSDLSILKFAAENNWLQNQKFAYHCSVQWQLSGKPDEQITHNWSSACPSVTKGNTA